MPASDAHLLERELVKRVLERLGIPLEAEPTTEGLRRVYAAWCEQVPFDNVRKMIHVHSRSTLKLPGSMAADYFKDWLHHGTGGTCWAGAGALHALLSAMGFHTERALGTMLVAPDLAPNHGSVLVRIGHENFLLDTSILHHEPLLMLKSWETCIDHPAWGIRCYDRGGRWHIQWRPLHKPDGFECRFESFGISDDEYQARYDQTRGWSPFNYQVCARRNCGDEVIGLAFGNFIKFRADGSVITTPLDDAGRRRVLIEDFGMSQEIIDLLPPDSPTPPPPGSRTAANSQAR
ncbi:MAG: arylamine N-acetyltransferase [Luteolibacter sp.]